MRDWLRTPPPLVTVGQFGHFVRDAYFDDSLWEKNRYRPAAGGDQVLRRIRYRWNEQDRPVTRVNWFEAAAFAKWQDGVLPSWDEVIVWRTAVTNAEVAEWCSNWYNSRDIRPRARPEIPERRRVAGWDRCEYASPTLVDMEFGFRVQPRKGGNEDVCNGKTQGGATGSTLLLQ